MILINEWLPNPTGADTSGEWVELLNTGAATNLSGWQLKTKGGSKTVLSGTIGAEEYKVFPRSTTKLVLKNTDEGLSLYDASGKLVDQTAFLGSAPEGQSYARGTNGNFVWADPTPGVANKLPEISIAQNEIPQGQINHNLSVGDVTLLALGVGIIFATMVFIVIKRNNDLQKLLFGRN